MPAPTSTAAEPVEAPITAVQVYRLGATVTRSAALDAPFPERVEITGLPLSLSPETVRVRVLSQEGEGEVVIAGVHVTLHVRPRAEAPAAPTPAALRDARRALHLQLQARQQIEGEIALLSGIQSPPRPEGEEGQPPPISPMAARVALEGFTHAAITERTGQIRALDREIERLRAEVAALEDRLRRSTEADRIHPDELSHAVRLRLHAPAEGPVPERIVLAVDYFVPGVRWAPGYQCLIDREAGRVTLQMRASVVQRTGEDWSDVAVRFSSAAPTTRSRLPELSSVRIGKAQPPPPQGRGYRPPPPSSASLFEDFDAAFNPLMVRLLAGSPSYPAPPQVSPLRLPDLPQIAEEEDDDLSSGEEFDDAPPDEVSTRAYGGGGGGGAAAHDMRRDAGARKKEKGAPPPPPAPSAPMSAVRGRTVARRMSAPMDRLEAVEEERGEAEPFVDDGEGGTTAGGLRFSMLRLPAPDERAARGRLLPEVPAERYEAALRRAGARADFDIAGVLAARKLAAEQVALPAGLTPVQSVHGRFDYAWPAHNRLDIPGDGVVHTVPVLRWEGPCQVRYVLVPRVEPLAYRQAEIDNPAPVPLLAGPVEVYVDGQYAVTAALPLVGIGGKLELGLGAEQAIRCARNARFQERRSGEKVVAMTELIHDIEIELVNTLPRPARCEVRERIPHPAPGAEVVIDEEAVEPAWEVYRQRERGAPLEGGRRWQVTLPSGARQHLRARYIVKIYANNELVGGNRRET